MPGRRAIPRDVRRRVGEPLTEAKARAGDSMLGGQFAKDVPGGVYPGRPSKRQLGSVVHLDLIVQAGVTPRASSQRPRRRGGASGGNAISSTRIALSSP